MQLRKRPVMILVRDGWGHNPDESQNDMNALHLARTPNDDRYRAAFPCTLIKTSGEAVGLPEGVMGNSEVGHQNIGAGRVVNQEVMRITAAVRDGSFFENDTLKQVFARAKETGGNVHITGLCSDGQVHSDLTHLYALLEMARRLEFPGERVFVHAIMDGRDTAPYSGAEFLEQIEAKCKEYHVNPVASVIGRYYAMDRDNRWDRVEHAYRMLVFAEGDRYGSAKEGLKHYYDNPSEESRKGDEFVLPALVETPDRPFTPIRDGDSCIFFNFRGDRPRELTKAFTYDDFPYEGKDKDGTVKRMGFEGRGKKLDLYYATMTGYETGLPVNIVFTKPPKMKDIMGEYVSNLGLKQFRCAETEKYPHVTFFFNDYRDEPFDGEDRKLVSSPRDITTYDQRPAMSAREVTQIVLEEIETNAHDFMVLNFANCDMVGHTGNLKAAIEAAEVVDECVGKVVDAILARGGAVLLTADHGNSEQMFDPESDGAHTMHTTFDVPLTVIDDDVKGASLREGGTLADIAPTALALLGLDVPGEMTGRSLLES
jgi:2,3-bisphosphoglycerate-independent phosphoglycerate mutase